MAISTKVKSAPFPRCKLPKANFLLSSIKKMEQSLPDTISLNLADVGQAISFRTRVEPILDLKVFDALARAVAQRRQLELDYRKPGAEQLETRIVDPYHLANIN